jgi:hypothetical protein
VFDKYSTAVWVSDQNFDSASWGSGQRLFADDYHPNADTLTTARTINGVSFNGSANITITADPNAHTHGNITNAGAIGTTASLPIITTTSGVLTTGSFGTTVGTFAQGNDSRLSDARTPLSHTHGNITNAGAIGTTADLVAVTTTSGVLTTASRSGIDSRTAFPTTYANITGTVPTWNQSTTGNAATATTLATARTINGVSFNGSANITITAAPNAHTHGNISNTGTVSTNTFPASGQKIVMTDDSNNIIQSQITLGTQTNLFLRNDGFWVAPGDVTGPASSVNARIATFNGTTGKIIQDSGTLISSLATSTHTHGNLANNGTVTNQGSIVSTDQLLVTSSTGALKRAVNAFGTSTTTFLANNGSFLTPNTISETRASTALQFWSGTQAQYDAIGTKNANTIYFIGG